MPIKRIFPYNPNITPGKACIIVKCMPTTALIDEKVSEIIETKLTLNHINPLKKYIRKIHKELHKKTRDYLNPKAMAAACMWIFSIRIGKRVPQVKCGEIFNTNAATIKKYYHIFLEKIDYYFLSEGEKSEDFNRT